MKAPMTYFMRSMIIAMLGRCEVGASMTRSALLILGWFCGIWNDGRGDGEQGTDVDRIPGNPNSCKQ